MIDNLALTKFEKIYADSYETISKYVVCNCSNIEDVKDIIQNITWGYSSVGRAHGSYPCGHRSESYCPYKRNFL